MILRRAQLTYTKAALFHIFSINPLVLALRNECNTLYVILICLYLACKGNETICPIGKKLVISINREWNQFNGFEGK